MYRTINRVCRLLLLQVFAVPAADAASAEQRRLTIDPRSFERMPADRLDRLSRRGARSLEAAGPAIALHRPDDNTVFATGEPIGVHVEFLPAQDRVAPDMKLLKVRVRQGWFGKTITDMVAPFVRGTAIRIPQVDFSGYTGDFEFRITIRDRRGRTGTASFRIRIEA